MVKQKVRKEPVQLTEPHIIPGKFDLTYTYSVGALGTRFFIQLRDNQKIMGIRCPQCNRVYVPPRLTCFRCFSKLDEWVEVSDKGTVLTYTVVNYPEPIYPMEPPFVYGVIQLDGADTGLVHLIAADTEQLRIGMRVQAVFREKREGNIKDIRYFKPL